MTDNEIIKALECCVLDECEECPAHDYSNCNNDVKRLAVDLINRQKSEIEKLQSDNHTLWMKADILTDFINGAWIETENIQTALNIDFSTGLKLFDFSRTAEWNPPPLNGQKITTKFRMSHNKAIKEFADKLKQKCLFDRGFAVMDDSVIDTLVKEMVNTDADI